MFLPYLKSLLQHLLLLLGAHQVQLMRRRLVVGVVVWCSGSCSTSNSSIVDTSSCSNCVCSSSTIAKLTLLILGTKARRG